MQNGRAIAILSAAAALLALPIFFRGFPIIGHDGRQHLLWTVLFSEQFWAGEWYPRWLPGLYEGFGGPSFFVYGPFPYWLGALLAPLARRFPQAPPGFVALTVSAILAIWLSTLGAFLWLRERFAPAAALAGALAYLIAPYHVLVDLYLRAAVPEFWSFVWMPLVLYFTDRLLRGRRYAMGGLAAIYALLLTTHLFVTLMFSPIALAYALYFSEPQKRVWSAAKFAAGMLLGIGLGSVYLLPALVHERYVSAAAFAADPVFYWRNTFSHLDGRLFRIHGIWPDFFQLITTLMILSAIAVVLLFMAGARRFWLAAACASLFMMTRASTPVWEVTPLLGNLQFPWRFQTVLTLATAGLFAEAAQSGAGRSGWLRKTGLAGLGLMALVWLGIFGRTQYLLAQQDPQPAWKLDTNTDQMLRVWTKARAPFPVMDLVQVESGDARVAVTRWSPRDIRVRVDSAAESRMLFHQFYYPGWTAGSGAAVSASERGLVRVTAPAGGYELRLVLDGGRMEAIGPWVSAASLLTLLLLTYVDYRAPAG